MWVKIPDTGDFVSGKAVNTFGVEICITLVQFQKVRAYL